MYLVRYSRGHDCISRTKVFSRDICEEVPYLQARYLFPLKYVFDKELWIRSLMCLEITHTNCNDKHGNQWSNIFSTVRTQKKIFDFMLWFLIISNLPCNGPSPGLMYYWSLYCIGIRLYSIGYTFRTMIQSRGSLHILVSTCWPNPLTEGTINWSIMHIYAFVKSLRSRFSNCPKDYRNF